jgi:hypothetical protein
VLKHYSEGQKDALMQGYGAYLETFIMLHRNVEQPWRGLAIFGLQFVKLLPAFALCGLIVSIIQLFINKRGKSLDYFYFMIANAAVAGTILLLIGVTRSDIVHIAFVGSLGLCGVAITFHHLRSWNFSFHLPLTIAWSIISILFIANFTAKLVMTYEPSRKMKDWRGEILKLGVANWIDANLEANERIVTAYGGLQYLYIRHAAIGFTFLPFESPKYYSEEQWRKIGSQILKNLPPVIAVTKEQWFQITQRTPELKPIYKLINNRFLLREGFIINK